MLCRSTVVASVFLLVAGCGGSSKKADSPADHEPALDQDDAPPTGHRAGTPGMDDDEDEDGVEIEGLLGHLDSYDIEAGVAPHSAALAQCFKGKARKMHFLGGQVELAFVVARDGSVKSVRANKSSVGSWAVEHCLLEEGVTMTFKKPKGGEAEFSLPLEFEARRSANWWTEEKAEAELADLPQELKKCKKEAGARDPDNVWVTLYLGNRGVIQSAGFASPHKDGIDPLWADCAATKIVAWTLNDPRGKIAKLGFRYNPE